MKVPFLNLSKQYRALSGRLDKAVSQVIKRQDFILGRDVALFEREFADYCGAGFCVGVNSGTDALFLSLKALGIGEGDEVVVPDFTFIATAFAVTSCGARPVFADIDETAYNMDVRALEKAVTRRTKAVIPVHLFGRCAPMDDIRSFCRKRGIAVIEDACQAHGAVYRGKRAGTVGQAGCFSFYPTKNLGGWGDGGAVVTDSRKLFERLRTMRDCGRRSRYEHVMMGYNSRLDTLQAAVLRAKLPFLDEWNKKRVLCAGYYAKLLRGSKAVSLPEIFDDFTHVYHVFAVRSLRRDALLEHLKVKGITAAVNYPIPLHLQPVYKPLGYKRGDFPVSESVAKTIISLPIHPFITAAEIRFVVRSIEEEQCPRKQR